MRYKNKVEMFPSNIVANMFSFKSEPFFQMEEPKERVALRSNSHDCER